MKNDLKSDSNEVHRRLEETYKSQKPRLLARLRRAGRTLEEAEDLVHEVYAATMERLHLAAGIYNLPAWINASVTRRMIDLWRRDEIRKKRGETDVAEETLREIIDGAGLDPLDGYVRDCLIDALNDALKVLPPEQRKVLEAQVFGGMTFREIGEATGISIDTLTARKRYAVRNLSRALRHWIEH